jgi:hypothetical protein
VSLKTNNTNKKNHTMRKRKKSHLTTKLSAAKVSNTPQVHHEGLSYLGQTLLLLLQHEIDGNNIKVPENDTSWEVLVKINEKAKFIDKKNHVKEIFSVNKFPHIELEKIAIRITNFIKVIQPQNVIK